MKVILFADGSVGRKIAEFLLNNYSNDLDLVVTTSENEIYKDAERSKIPVAIFESDRKIIKRLKKAVDLGVLAWWPKLLKQQLLEVPLNGFVNTHPSLLPHNRGKHYNFWTLVEEAPFGVTIHKVDMGVDTGDIVTQKKINYDWSDTGETLYKKAQIEMVDLFINTYPILRTGNFDTTPQNRNSGSMHYASELIPASQIKLDEIYKARTLLNLLRGKTFKGYNGCWFEENGSKYEISISIKRLKT